MLLYRTAGRSKRAENFEAASLEQKMQTDRPMQTWKMMDDFGQLRQWVKGARRFQMSHLNWLLDRMQRSWGLDDRTGITQSEVSAVARQMKSLRTFLDQNRLPMDEAVLTLYADLAHGPIGRFVDQLYVERLGAQMAIVSFSVVGGGVGVLLASGKFLSVVAGGLVGATVITCATVLVGVLTMAALVYEGSGGHASPGFDNWADAVTTRVAAAAWHLLHPPNESPVHGRWCPDPYAA